VTVHDPRCPYCGEPALDVAHATVATERQFGLGGRFRYATCASCASLALLDVPDDLAPYYPSDYYSLTATRRARSPMDALRRAATRHAITGRGVLGRLAALADPPPSNGMHAWLRLAGVGRTSHILDVGCGTGALLRALGDAGYERLTGVDPFLPADDVAGPVRLLRREVDAIDGPFDLVMLHHVLEHVPDPERTMRAVRGLLSPGGRVLVRVPIVPNEMWDRHGASWVQLDAPRHLTIPSERGLTRLAERCGLRLVASRQDSTPIQYWGTALYERGLTLQHGARTLSWLERRRGRRRARAANASGRGDQAAFLFAPADAR